MLKIKERKVIEMEKELDSCLFVFEAIGLQYFSLKSLTKESIKKPLSTSRKFYMLFILVLVLFLMITCFVISRMNPVKRVTAKNVLMLTIRNIMTIGLLLIVLTSIIQAFLTTKNIQKVFLNTKELAMLSLMKYHLYIDFKMIKKLVLRQIACIVLFVIVVYGTLAIFEDREFTIEILILKILSTIPIFFLLITTFKFIFYVELVNNQLKFLENLTMNINEDHSITMEDEFLTSVFPAHQQRNLSNKLETAWKIYNLVYENGELINRSHGLTILILLTVLVITLTVSGYEGFVIMIGDMSKNKIPSIVHNYTISLAILTATVAFCQKTHQILSNIATNICKFKSKNFRQLLPETRELLEDFLMQVVHRPIQFTAFGIYPINLALLASIVTGVVSYQIILVQFYAS